MPAADQETASEKYVLFVELRKWSVSSKPCQRTPNFGDKLKPVSMI